MSFGVPSGQPPQGHAAHLTPPLEENMPAQQSTEQPTEQALVNESPQVAEEHQGGTTPVAHLLPSETPRPSPPEPQSTTPPLADMSAPDMLGGPAPEASLPENKAAQSLGNNRAQAATWHSFIPRSLRQDKTADVSGSGNPGVVMSKQEKESVLQFLGEDAELEALSGRGVGLSGRVAEEGWGVSSKDAPCHVSVRNLTYTVQRSIPLADLRLRFLQLGAKVSPALTEGVQELRSKTILNDVSFEAAPGRVLAVVGPSGAGKSTILDALAGRIHPSNLRGEISFAQKEAVRSRRVGYVTQDDNLYAVLTPRETLMFSANVRLPRGMSAQEKARRVDDVLTDLGLQHVADSRIGDPAHGSKRGASGGEQRRISIGTELVHDPNLLLLDEPTTSLDSHSALKLAETLRGMADRSQRTIILSIHQPSSRILALIDDLLLMARGTVVYHGQTPGLEALLQARGYDIPARANFLEFAIDLLQEATCPPQGKEGFTQKLAQVLGPPVLTSSKEVVTSAGAEGDKKAEVAAGCRLARGRGAMGYTNRFWSEVFHLCGRNFKVMSRDPKICKHRFITTCLYSFLLGTLFFQMKTGLANLKDNLGFYAGMVGFLFGNAMDPLPVLIKERHTYRREAQSRSYRVLSYILACAISYTPYLAVLSFTFSTPAYWLAGLPATVHQYLFTVLTMWCVLMNAMAIVSLAAACFPEFMGARSLALSVFQFCFLFSGYFISREALPVYWSWMSYLSIYKYPFDALIINQYEGSDDESSSQIMSLLDLKGENKWAQLAALTGYTALYWVLCYGALCLRHKRKT